MRHHAANSKRITRPVLAQGLFVDYSGGAGHSAARRDSLPICRFGSCMPKEIHSLTQGPFNLLCPCGAPVPLDDRERISCSCGRELGRMRDGVAVVAPLKSYWGEIPKSQMAELLARSAQIGWRSALLEVAPALDTYVASPNRAAFQDLLPIPETGRILDVGAGLGGISAALAVRHHVVALEGVPERCQFMAVRKKEDGLNRLTILNAGIDSMHLAPGQFDAIIVNGVLEWVAVFDLSGPTEKIQEAFLKRLRELLAPGGVLYVGIENRFGWAQFRGSPDHSGLPYTSLMPRWLARFVCNRSRHRSDDNRGYRTFTYSFSGYRRLFARSGLKIGSMWIATNGYNLPTELVPLNGQAIAFYSKLPLVQAVPGWRALLKNRLKLLAAKEWFWRRFGSDYVFVLERYDA